VLLTVAVAQARRRLDEALIEGGVPQRGELPQRGEQDPIVDSRGAARRYPRAAGPVTPDRAWSPYCVPGTEERESIAAIGQWAASIKSAGAERDHLGESRAEDGL
jgi:hypothetical protein